MNKIPNENWQAHMLRELSTEVETIWVPSWISRVVKSVGQFFGAMFILIFFCAIPAIAWELACAILGL